MAQSRLSPNSVTLPEKPSSVQWRGPLFVIGTWRSGTSLLYALLNKHPQIALMYEGDLPLLRPLFWMPGGGARWLARWEFWNNGLTRHKLDGSRMRLNASHFPSAMEEVYQAYARQKGALIWGDKSPNYYDSLVWLAREFPDARFVIIWRDPTSIIRSIVRAAEENSFFGQRGMAIRALMGYRVLKTECDRLVSRGSRVHYMQYEALVRDPARVMADVCKFLDIPFVPNVGFLDGADRSAIYQAQHHALVRGEQIVSSLERAELLPVELKRKIKRYESLWWEESGQKWPILSSSQDCNCEKPSLWERLVDRVLYRCLRIMDSIVVVAYCSVPLPLLRGIRSFRRRHDRKGAMTEPSEDTPSTVSDTNRAT